jgi:hypothetical protein
MMRGNRICQNISQNRCLRQAMEKTGALIVFGLVRIEIITRKYITLYVCLTSGTKE